MYGYLDGTTVEPTAEGEEEDITEKKEEWLVDKTKAHHFLAQKLHDSTLTKLLHLK